MVGKYGVTVEEVRNYQGLNDIDIGEAPVETFIKDSEEEMERITSRSFVLTEEVETLEGEGEGLGSWTQGRSRILMLSKTPIGRIKQARINFKGDDKTDIDVSTLEVKPKTGKVLLTDESEEDAWNPSDYIRNVVRYTHGEMKESYEVETDTTSDVSPGDSVAIPVNDASNLAEGDYVKIEGIDGNEETVEVESVSTGQVTVEGLSLDHESGSRLVKMEIPRDAKHLVKVLASIRVAAYKIGGTQDFQSSYNLGDLEVQKGEPYPPFKQLLPEFKRERDRLVSKLKKPSVA